MPNFAYFLVRKICDFLFKIKKYVIKYEIFKNKFVLKQQPERSF